MTRRAADGFKPGDEKRTKNLHLVIRQSTYDALKGEAEKAGTSMNRWVENAIRYLSKCDD